MKFAGADMINAFITKIYDNGKDKTPDLSALVAPTGEYCWKYLPV
jgi:hypothetical protein